MKRTGPVGIVTLVCLTCGKEHFYEYSVPMSVTCETCAGKVFRQYATPTEPDEASIAQLEDQARMALDDVSIETALDDVQELDAQ